MKSRWFLSFALLLVFALTARAPVWAAKCNIYDDDFQGVIQDWESQSEELIHWKVRALDQTALDYLKENKIYVSLTTSPQRIKMLNFVIDTLDLAHVETVFVSIPKKFGRTGEGYIIPDYVKNHPKIKILETEIDDGPVMKLLTAAEHLQAENAKGAVLTVDDDTGYPKGLINEMIIALSRHPDAVISNFGGIAGDIMIETPWGQKLAKDVESKVRLEAKIPGLDIETKLSNFIEGWGGLLYPINRINTQRLRVYSKLNPEAFVSDDMVIAAMLAVGGVPRIEIRSKYTIDIRQYNYGRINALFNGAGMPTSVFQSFRDQDPNSDGLIYSEASGEYELYKYKKAFEAIENYEKKKVSDRN